MKKQNCLIYCNCGGKIIAEDKQNLLINSIKKLKIDVYELNDICSFSINEKDFLRSLEENYNKKYIVACYPRAIENIFSQNNITLSNFEVLNFKEQSPESIIDNLEQKIPENSYTHKYEVKKSNLEVPAWYPVIDQSRCTLCGQCARFCMFGVYKYNKKSLEVINPLSCKNNCPACGRTCPTSAIIFPRLPENSVLSGAEPGSTENTSQVTKNEGLFVMLNERNNNRRNIFRQGVLKQAEEERQKAIEELKKELGKK